MSRRSGCFRPRQDSKAKWHLGCSVVKVWPGVIKRPPELQWRCSEVPVSCTKFAVPLLMDITVIFFLIFDYQNFEIPSKIRFNNHEVNNYQFNQRKFFCSGMMSKFQFFFQFFLIKKRKKNFLGYLILFYLDGLFNPFIVHNF